MMVRKRDIHMQKNKIRPLAYYIQHVQKLSKK